MRRRHPLCNFLAALLLYSAPTSAVEPPDNWRFSLESSYRYGQVDGYVQIPSGGEKGTTSSHRPHLSEIGIDNASIYDVQALGVWRNEEFYLGAQFIRLSGDDTLGTTLISHGETFPAGTSVNSDVHLDWYRFGYRHRFMLFAGDAEGNNQLSLSPGIGVAVLDFSYNLDASGPGGSSASRSFIHETPQLVLNSEYKPWRALPLTIELNLFASPFITSSIPGIFDEELLARWRLIEHGRLEVDAFGGVAFEQIRFHDNENVSNRINADFGPMLVVGFKIQF